MSPEALFLSLRKLGFWRKLKLTKTLLQWTKLKLKIIRTEVAIAATAATCSTVFMSSMYFHFLKYFWTIYTVYVGCVLCDISVLQSESSGFSRKKFWNEITRTKTVLKIAGLQAALGIGWIKQSSSYWINQLQLTFQLTAAICWNDCRKKWMKR